MSLQIQNKICIIIKSKRSQDTYQVKIKQVR